MSYRPALADLPDQRAWRIDAGADYGPLNVAARGRIDLEKIRRQWPDILRVVGSIYAGSIRAVDVVRMLQREGAETDLVIPDVGPHIFRYSESDRVETPRFWMSKLQREVSAFAHEVVRVGAQFAQLVIASPALRAGYARLVEWEVFRVIEGRSAPQPTQENDPIRLDLSAYQSGVPELVAAELVRDVVDPKEFDEFSRRDHVTVLSQGKYYRIPRQPQAVQFDLVFVQLAQCDRQERKRRQAGQSERDTDLRPADRAHVTPRGQQQ